MGCSALMVLLPAADREVIVRRKTVRVRTDKTGWDTFVRLFMVQFTNNEGPDVSVHPIGDGQLHRRCFSQPKGVLPID